MPQATKNVLVIHSSSRRDGSNTRILTSELISTLTNQNVHLSVVERDLADGMPFVDQAWIEANFTASEDRSADQSAALSYSDALVDELIAADVIIIAAPVYNFGIPASLKAWVDQIARARLTFKYTDNGPVGLLNNKRAVIVTASGGTEIGSDTDFATSYMRHILGFIGINNVSVIAADRMMIDPDTALAKARTEINQVSQQISDIE